MNTKVDELFANLSQWKAELDLLRTFVLDCGLEEAYKWKQACYVFKDKNVLILSGFKEYCAVNFFKGTLLRDEFKLLTSPGPNSNSAMQLRFTNVQQIKELEQDIKAYIFEAIEVEKLGLKVKTTKVEDFDVPKELIFEFNQDPIFKEAFETLTAGRQKGYLLHFSGAKQSKTVTSRILKNKNRIMKGKGLNDCLCGHSKRMPSCDGSHKYFKEANQISRFFLK